MLKRIIFATLALLVFLAAYNIIFSSGNQNNQRPALLVELVSVKEYEISDKIEALGNLYSDESADITANVSEIIREIKFEDGAIVKKGDVIAILEQNEEQAQLSGAKANLNENIREKNRLETLLKSKAATKRDYDERVTQIQIASQQIKEIQARIDDRTITAPFDGVLGIRAVSVGTLIQPGQVITTIDNIQQVKLDFYIPSTFLNSLEVGVPIKAKAESLGGQVFEGKVEAINSRIDPNTRSVMLRAIIPNKDLKLKSGMLLTIEVVNDKREAIVVPEETIIMRKDKYFVYKVGEDNKVQQVEVKAGVRRNGEIEITDGLKLGDKIIVRGMNYVQDGKEVKVKTIWESNKNPDTPLNTKNEGV